MVDMFPLVSMLILGMLLGASLALLLIQPTLENLRRANARLVRSLKNDR